MCIIKYFNKRSVKYETEISELVSWFLYSLYMDVAMFYERFANSHDDLFILQQIYPFLKCLVRIVIPQWCELNSLLMCMYP